ncbi:MAG: sugar ABC transporter ATP-binding protein [Eubacteriales bacterium]|jgi:putative multiple sugar transport system ATP-binding protein|nr:sugar ABC transporter ATP-binding protein [Eubacteriales bacterium]MDD4105774.1 sugar ABC transporter ATP-binding protein [Eubacteriales bacterium]MDD4710756.1 sugar ABC transporter ATP-binding protein [Eubacteriales bacterium]NLO14577.1 sugar ABC transporter ATP-binding protein [Clostridiales bacterium]
MASTILRMENITKLFPGVKALDNVNIDVTEGEIHAVVGENGAGKSTLMNVLSGIHPYGSYTGEVYYRDELCLFRTIKDSERRGIAIIHQELALVPHLSIAENMYLGNEQGNAGVINWDLTNQQAAKFMDVVGLKENPRTLIKDIGMGKQQLVEIAKALAKDVRLLILDEPTSSLNEIDAKKLLDLLIEFKIKHGITSILISHKLNEIEYCADRITILRDGKSIETLDKKSDEISEPRIIKGMVGREMTSRFPERRPIPRGDVAFEIKNWTVHHPLYADKKVVNDVSLKIHHGEVVGLAGLIGAGRTELAMSVFGGSYGQQITGEALIDGKPIRLASISQAIQNGLAYVTEDRKGNGLMITNSIKHNLTLSRIEFVSKRGIIDKDLETIRAGDQKEQLDIKAPTVEQYVENLSGGNQQKVLLGKWIFAKPDILLLDEPTRGVDVGAKYEIYQIINQLAAEGKAVLMISSELPELLGMCDRIYVMNESKLIGEFSREEASQENIMGCILQASKGEISA